MHRLTFYPLGNADCCLIDLANGQKILFDYADVRCEDDPEDLRIPLGEELRKNLKDANRDFFDVVAFTHLDNDHICKSSEFSIRLLTENFKSHNLFLWRQLTASGPSPNTFFLSP
jgi:hypothetical protein